MRTRIITKVISIAISVPIANYNSQSIALDRCAQHVCGVRPYRHVESVREDVAQTG